MSLPCGLRRLRRKASSRLYGRLQPRSRGGQTPNQLRRSLAAGSQAGGADSRHSGAGRRSSRLSPTEEPHTHELIGTGGAAWMVAPPRLTSQSAPLECLITRSVFHSNAKSSHIDQFSM